MRNLIKALNKMTTRHPSSNGLVDRCVKLNGFTFKMNKKLSLLKHEAMELEKDKNNLYMYETLVTTRDDPNRESTIIDLRHKITDREKLITKLIADIEEYAMELVNNT